MDIQQFFQNKKITYLEIAVVAVILAVAVIYFFNLFGWGEKISVMVRNGKVIEENLVIPQTEKAVVNEGRVVNEGAYQTPLVPKSDEERIIAPLAELTLKGSYNVSINEAKKWSDDAKLVFIKSLGAVTLEGKSSQWQIIFGSKNKKKGYEIIVQKDKIVSQKEIFSDSFGYDLPDNWRDSNYAVGTLQATPQFSDATVSSINFYYNVDGKKWSYALSTSRGTTSMPVE